MFNRSFKNLLTILHVAKYKHLDIVCVSVSFSRGRYKQILLFYYINTAKWLIVYMIMFKHQEHMVYNFVASVILLKISGAPYVYYATDITVVVEVFITNMI